MTQIRYVHGDLLEAPEMIIAHGCNAQGVMRSGVAKALREKWPVVFDEYRERYEWRPAHSETFLGSAHLVQVEKTRGVLNCITQQFYGREENRRYLSYDALDSSLRSGIKQVQVLVGDWDRKIAIPLIGAGLAQGRWPIIAEILREIAFDTKVQFVVYVPDQNLKVHLDTYELWRGRLNQSDYSVVG